MGIDAVFSWLPERQAIIVGNKDKDVKVESHEFQKDEK